MPLALLGTEKFFRSMFFNTWRAYFKCKRSGQKRRTIVQYGSNRANILLILIIQIRTMVIPAHMQSYLPPRSCGMHRFFILNICRTCCENSARHSDHHLRACWRHCPPPCSHPHQQSSWRAQHLRHAACYNLHQETQCVSAKFLIHLDIPSLISVDTTCHRRSSNLVEHK